MWWDMGKVHLKTLTRTYGVKAARERRDQITFLQQSISDLQSSPDISQESQKSLKGHRDSLNDLFKYEAKGALVRARFQYTK